MACAVLATQIESIDIGPALLPVITTMLHIVQVLILAILGMNVLLAMVNDTFAAVMQQAREEAYVLIAVHMRG